MSSPSFTEAFIIIHQNKNSEPFEIFPYSTSEANYVGAAITLCQAMLKEDHVKKSFNGLMMNVMPSLKQDLADRWLGNGDPVGVFINKVLEKFPLVFVNDAMENPDNFAIHIRSEMVDSEEFDTHRQCIVLNGEIVRRLCVAGTNAENVVVSNGSDSAELNDFHKFLFQLTRALVHELAHVFVTMLGNGKAPTPPVSFVDEAGAVQIVAGEAGALLETWIYCGLSSVVYDPTQGADQPGRICTVNTTGHYEVSRKAINDFVKYQFSFPIQEGMSIGYEHETLGSVTGKPENWPASNPVKHPKTKDLLLQHGLILGNQWEQRISDLVAQNPDPQRFGSSFGALMMRIPNEPGLRVE